MMTTRVSRRGALKVLGAVPFVAAFAQACGGGATEPESCNDVTTLSEPEKAVRTALQYVDRSTFPDKKCSGCNLYQPAPTPTQCGGCQVVKGPIHPQGYCTSWVKKA